MNKQKQIEEMASCLIGSVVTGANSTKVLNIGYITARELASILINAGYRKLPENAMVLTREEYKSLYTEEEYEKVYEQAEADILANMADGGTSCHWCIDKHEKIGYEKGSKETAEKFAERLKFKLEKHERKIMREDYQQGAYIYMVESSDIETCIDEICKEITEGEK